MSELEPECIFGRVGKCLSLEQLSKTNPGSGRLRHVIESSKSCNDGLHVTIQQSLESDPTYSAYYHRQCVSSYLL